jgi:hypothetical protein
MTEPKSHSEDGNAREPTSGLELLTCSLRVRQGMFLLFAEGCKIRIPKLISFPQLAHHCGALRPR